MFVGTVISITGEPERHARNPKTVDVALEVAAAWKGVDAPLLIITTTAPGNGCEFPFEAG